MEFVKCAVLGRGSFATVHLAATTDESSRQIIAVKSAALPQSASLRREADVLSKLQGCPQIVTCYGHGVGAEKGVGMYDVLLEYVAGGSLTDYLRAAGGRLQESVIARVARSAVKGLCFIHAAGYVHCDIKPQNLLVTPSLEVKIADFGLAKAAGELSSAELLGTPLYMSPEAVAKGEHEAAGDVWALGCVVAELFAGKPAWGSAGDVAGLLFRIGFGGETPDVPDQASEQGKDFIRRCLELESSKRWTAEMLLNHPFLAGEEDDNVTTSVSINYPSYSPKSVFDFCSGFSWETTESIALLAQTEQEQRCSAASPSDRIKELVSDSSPPSWFSSSSDDWVSAWESDSSVSQPCTEDHPESVLDKMVAGIGRRDQLSVCELESVDIEEIASTAAHSISSSSPGNAHPSSDALFSDHGFSFEDCFRTSIDSFRLIDYRCRDFKRCNNYNQYQSVKNDDLISYEYKIDSCYKHLHIFSPPNQTYYIFSHKRNYD